MKKILYAGVATLIMSGAAFAAGPGGGESQGSAPVGTTAVAPYGGTATSGGTTGTATGVIGAPVVGTQPPGTTPSTAGGMGDVGQGNNGSNGNSGGNAAGNAGSR